MSQLGIILQEALRREREARTIVGFLRAKMEHLERERRRRNIKDRLGFPAMGCCGASWGCRATAISVREEDEDEDDELQPAAMPSTDQSTDPRLNHTPAPSAMNLATALTAELDPRLNHTPAPSAMNLATALTAERQLRPSPPEMKLDVEGGSISGAGTGTPGRVSLMRLLEESDGGEKEKKRGERGDSVCCVCMGRKKGAAFIPCGHTFCRVCSRELWLNRGSCPLCNRWIMEILDIF